MAKRQISSLLHYAQFFYLPLSSYFIYLFIYLFIYFWYNARLNKILQINSNKSVIPLWQGNIRS